MWDGCWWKGAGRKGCWRGRAVGWMEGAGPRGFRWQGRGDREEGSAGEVMLVVGGRVEGGEGGRGRGREDIVMGGGRGERGLSETR